MLNILINSYTSKKHGLAAYSYCSDLDTVYNGVLMITESQDGSKAILNGLLDFLRRVHTTKRADPSEVLIIFVGTNEKSARQINKFNKGYRSADWYNIEWFLQELNAKLVAVDDSNVMDLKQLRRNARRSLLKVLKELKW